MVLGSMYMYSVELTLNTSYMNQCHQGKTDKLIKSNTNALDCEDNNIMSK